MNNFKQPGDVLDLTAPTGGVESGVGYVIGSLFVVATADADEGDQFQGQSTGVFEFPKATGAWSEGDPIYWDESEEECTKTATDNVAIGVAVADALSGDATGRVKLGPPSAGSSIATAELEAGSVTYAKAAVFISTEQTGTGSAQNIAHGLGVAPTKVLVAPTELAADLTAGYDAAQGTHTSTNVVVTVTSGAKFQVLAWA